MCELTGFDVGKLTKDKFYEIALHLYKVKDNLEKPLSICINNRFDLKDKIIFYNFTTTKF